MASKKYVFRAMYGGYGLGEKKLAIIALDFTEALKKALAKETVDSLSVGSDTSGESRSYELMALKRGEVIDVE